MADFLEPHVAIAKIRSILETGFFECEDDHCLGSMEKRTVFEDDVLEVLAQNGIIEDDPVLDKYGDYRYKVVGKDLEGDHLEVVVVIDERNWTVRVITVIG